MLDISSFYTCTKNHNHDVWFLRYGVRQTEYFVIMDRFLPFYPPMDPKNQNFEKMKKTLEDIIILQALTINDSHMIYGFSDMECNRNFFFVILDRFLPFYPLTSQKIKILKNWKNPWRYHHFTQVYLKSWSYTILFRVWISKTKSIRKKFWVYQRKRPATGEYFFGFVNHFNEKCDEFFN